ncbi:MAG: hypothetical protein ABIA04_12310 [Pseudomonadota bacterium]
MQNFEKIIKLFIDNDVDFVLIGGLAATLHGSSIATQDIDFCVSFAEENCEKILKAIDGINPIHRDIKKPFKENSQSLSKYKNLYLITDLGSIDMLGLVSGLGDYKKLISQSIEVDLFNRKCKVLSIDALIKTKKEMQREKDKETIFQLEAIKEKTG